MEMEDMPDIEPDSEECKKIEHCEDCPTYCFCTMDFLGCELQELKETVGKSFLRKDLQVLTLKLALRALLLKFNSKQANEGMKSNIREQLMMVVPKALKDAEEEVEKENMSEENLAEMKKGITTLLDETLDEIFMPPEGIANNL